MRKRRGNIATIPPDFLSFFLGGDGYVDIDAFSQARAKRQFRSAVLLEIPITFAA